MTASVQSIEVRVSASARSVPPRRCFACGAHYSSRWTFPLCSLCDEDAIEHARSYERMEESQEFARREACWLKRFAQLDPLAAQAYQSVRAVRRQQRGVAA